MVRTVMYLFLLFVVAWNFNATSHVFSFQPELEDAGDGDRYCHPTAYW